MANSWMSTQCRGWLAAGRTAAAPGTGSEVPTGLIERFGDVVDHVPSKVVR